MLRVALPFSCQALTSASSSSQSHPDPKSPAQTAIGSPARTGWESPTTLSWVGGVSGSDVLCCLLPVGTNSLNIAQSQHWQMLGLSSYIRAKMRIVVWHLNKAANLATRKGCRKVPCLRRKLQEKSLQHPWSPEAGVGERGRGQGVCTCMHGFSFLIPKQGQVHFQRPRNSPPATR